MLSPIAFKMLSTRIGYRSEVAYGEGYRDAREVIRHEVQELGNEDVLTELRRHLNLSSKASLSQVVDEVNRRFGVDAVALWLADRQTVIEYYEGREGLDRYVIPPDALLAVDIGYDGQMFLMPKASYDKTMLAVTSETVR